MADATGYKFIYFSAVFYLFLGAVLAMGAGEWLSASVSTTDTIAIGNYSTNVTSSADIWDISQYVLQNPFSGLGWLAWLSVAILITDIYIVVTSLIP